MSYNFKQEIPMRPLLLSRRQAAAMLGLCEKSLDHLLKDGRLPSIQVGGRVMVHVDDLNNFARTGTAERIRNRDAQCSQ